MEVPETLTYTFDWRRDEYARVSRLLARERQRVRSVRIARGMIYVILAVSALGVYASAMRGDPAGAVQLGAMIVLVIVLLAGFPWFVGALLTRQTERHDPNIGYPIRHTYDAEGLHVATRTADATLRWDGLRKVQESDDFFLFHYSARLAYYLPKRVVADLPAFRAAVRDWLPESVPFETR